MKRRLALLLWLTASLSAGAVLAHGPGQDHHAATNVAISEAVDAKAPDVLLVDQDRARQRLVSDWIGQRVAVVTFTFSDCTTACPLVDHTFVELQKRLGAELGQGVVLLTITIDPATDISDRLRARAAKLGAAPGWRFLTGKKSTVLHLLQALEVYSADRTEHPPTVFVVDGAHGAWTRLNGFPRPDAIMGVVEHLRHGEAQT